jgi:O-antigen/teichoic acid export membrane protein
VFTLFSIPLNFFLIKYFGLKGAAFSSLVSLTVYNSIRFAFLYRKFNLQPYTIKSLLSLVIAAVTYLLVYSIPRFDNLFADIFVRTSVFVFVFLPLVFVCKITPDLNKVVIDRTKTLLEKTGLRK